ncbi:Imm1 family immunity protein [Streptomyces clavuligerus]|uniref:Imm1 family immunity protein n=1 Tax=Streptomyces clavuligerus TaxID=1901 RepID=UPI0001852135|nr:Imm1 family immunity protein [Streptomyces clavuligerus]WDN56008.1 hypothetical protein LL058_29420 [Streptomyces clavuligerus]
MILNVTFQGSYHHAVTYAEMSALIGKVMNGLSHEQSGPFIRAGDTASFMFTRTPMGIPGHEEWPDHHLGVAVNTSTGYGGLTWYAMGERAKNPRDGISATTWVSDNPSPPAFDPRVVLDPCVPLFYDPRSTLPAPQIQAALEEFCRTGTGDRPNCVDWTRGHTNGQLLDAEW